jgi:1-acyl-sn-glycerol-3-phosphate acyltransferase
MLYIFFKNLCNYGVRFYFRCIYYLGSEKIPSNEPVLFVGNHSNSALDGIIISGLSARYDIFWLARGDVFKKKWVGDFMFNINNIPIYRASEVGYSDLKKNNETFDLCFKTLSQNKVVGIFAEGITVHERMLQRPFKKGAARLAFQAHEAINRPIKIVPVGVNYTHLAKTQASVFVNFGESFSTAPFYETYLVNQAKAIKEFTNYLEEKLNNQIINYDLVIDKTALETILEVNRNERNDKEDVGVIYESNKFDLENSLVNNLINGQNSQDLSYETLKNKANAYAEALSKNSLNDTQFIESKNGVSFFRKILGSLASIINFIPNTIAKNFVENKVKKIEFYTSVRFAISTIVYPLFIILSGIFSTFFVGKIGLLLIILLPIISYFGNRNLKSIAINKVINGDTIIHLRNNLVAELAIFNRNKA